MSEPTDCPCGSGVRFAGCCERWLRGGRAPTAESLMRSRYAAYVLRDADYLLATWHPHTRPSSLDVSTGPKWLGLSVRRTEAGGLNDVVGVVEFVARYRTNERAYRLHEVSRFERVEGAWCYVDGEQL